MPRLGRLLALVAALAVATPGCISRGPVISASRTVRATINLVARSDASTLTYFLVQPGGGARYPLVLYLDGSSCRSVTESLQYFPTLVENGYGVVAPEKRGVQPDDNGKACSEDFLRTNDRRQRVADADLLLAVLPAKVPRWDGRLVVIGGSEGATIAPEVAVRHPATVAVILMAGGAMDQARELEILKRKEPRAATAGDPEIERAVAEMNAKFREIEADPSPAKSWLGPANTYRRWASYLRYRPLDFLAKLTCPIYMVHGARDTAAPVESAEAAVAEFARLGQRNLTYRRYEHFDHRWNDEAGKNHLLDVGIDLMTWLYRTVPPHE